MQRYNVRRCQPSESRAAVAWLAERHYLKSAPPGHVFVLEFVDQRNERIGVMQVGRPTARQYDASVILELTRMYFVDDTEKNTESRALASMRHFVRKWFPEIRLLLAYSDPAVGHGGTIYQADGWAPFGQTDGAWGYGWQSRKGRREEHVSKKQRWVRTP